MTAPIPGTPSATSTPSALRDDTLTTDFDPNDATGDADDSAVPATQAGALEARPEPLARAAP
jgi:hypothetical protein